MTNNNSLGIEINEKDRSVVRGLAEKVARIASEVVEEFA